MNTHVRCWAEVQGLYSTWAFLIPSGDKHTLPMFGGYGFSSSLPLPSIPSPNSFTYLLSSAPLFLDAAPALLILQSVPPLAGTANSLIWVPETLQQMLYTGGSLPPYLSPPYLTVPGNNPAKGALPSLFAGYPGHIPCTPLLSSQMPWPSTTLGWHYHLSTASICPGPRVTLCSLGP